MSLVQAAQLPDEGESARSHPPESTATQVRSVRERDEHRHEPEARPSAEYLRHAARTSGRSPVSIAFEYLKLHRGRGKLTLPEYVRYGVYDPTHTEDERSRFLGELPHWPIAGQCCDFTWQATTEDKWLCARLLERSGVPVPPTVAIIDRSARAYPGTRTIRTPAALRELVLAHTREGDALFGKVNRGVASFGAFLVTEGDRDRLHVHGEGWMDYETFLAQVVGDTPYLLQRRERNHASFAGWTEYLATVRVYLLLSEGGGRAEIPFTVLKLPSADNVADNFWRPGNLVCDLDPETGTIRTARTMDAFGTTGHEAHPATGALLVGEALPAWDQVLDLARATAPIFAPVRYQSMDIAITKVGPLLVEINTGGCFSLPQFATGRGFLTDEVREFFRECGYAKV